MFWDRLEKRNLDDTVKEYTWGNLFNKGYDVTPQLELKETTYFKCIKYISESVAKCPIVLKKDTKDGRIDATENMWYEKLKLRPNQNVSAIDCIKAFVALGEHEGISGLYIDRDNYNLYPVRINNIFIDDSGLIESSENHKILIDFSCGNSIGSCFEEDIILYKAGISFDGINTKSNKSLLKNNIITNIKSQDYLVKLYDNGLTNKIVIQMISDIKDESELKRVQKKFDRLYSSNGRTFTVPAGFNASALNLSLADAQFEQLRKLSRREIANCFGLSPAQIGDLEDSNNNNMEMQNINFLTDTLLIKFEQIEQELDYKLLSGPQRKAGYKFKFNQNVFLRTDAKTQCEILTKYMTSGVYTPNNVRDILGIERIKDGDDILVSSGAYKLKDLTAITLNKKGGGKNE
ncbi:phage portal protein [Clostridium botulinum]|uniref:phage portal protein n=1 Tax=Clostridium botulinum TaxID=1491 RepID=UPI00069A13B7|nr:phage portal protein [Clostridium botulinum]KOA90866.1 hypothetical protein ADU76_12490 [Clostridium botulinum]MCD3203429.1 phage portal protein [Clostridium botulinum C/D]MCD3222292.1 phage portal protein [Clostridium botulinum C/D]MCD3231437.1 phage portal protein [Clostridium botulinum C/D]MCD3273065.1 phage portal protein [Clostridium botulinum C/D]